MESNRLINTDADLELLSLGGIAIAREEPPYRYRGDNNPAIRVNIIRTVQEQLG
jgi:hypothetical protein